MRKTHPRDDGWIIAELTLKANSNMTKEQCVKAFCQPIEEYDVGDYECKGNKVKFAFREKKNAQKRVTVNDLPIDKFFKFNIRQKKWRFVTKKHVLESPQHQGKTLLIYNGCKQAIMDGNDEVILRQ